MDVVIGIDPHKATHVRWLSATTFLPVLPLDAHEAGYRFSR